MGNRALGFTLQRACGCGGSGPVGHWADEERGPRLQPKLTVNTPGDASELEADRVADAVMRMPASGGTPPHLQRRSTAATGSGVAPPIVQEVLRAPGQPLDAASRAYLEPRLGHDLGHVRVHRDARAAESARAVDALAYTVGPAIVFGAGQYQPATRTGRRLLAHELVHVVQQGSAGAGGGLVQRELVPAAGYPNRFRSDEAEIRCFEAGEPTCKWSPSSVDFEATATQSGGGTAIGTFTGLLDHIARRSAGSITELGLIGHANATYFGLSGTITAHDVIFTDPGLIGADTIAANMARIEASRDRFSPVGKIVLYGCNAGVGLELLDALSRAFRVCVYGFSDEIFTCFVWAPRERRARRPRHIRHRGNVWTAVTTDPLPSERPERCADWHTQVRDLTPDRHSCVGVPATSAPTPTAPEPSPRRLGLEFRAGVTVADEGWRAAIDLGMRYSLRSDRVIVWNPVVGASLVYLPSSGDRVSHIAAAIVEFGLRVQQPLEGFYLDVRAGGYAGIRVPGRGSTGETQAIGGFTPSLGLGYHSERLSIGAEGRGLVGAGPNQFVIVGVGAWHW